MTVWVHRTILVTPQFVDLARALSSGLEPVAGANLFITEAYDITSGALRYYITSGLIADEFAALLSDATLLHSRIGGSVPLNTCESLLSNSIISSGTFNGFPEDVHSLLSRLGLTLQKSLA